VALSYRRYQNSRLNFIWIVILINFLLFIITAIFPELQYLLGLPSVGFFQRPWTIVTNLFIHANLWHIIANMLTFYFFGTALTRLIGKNKLLMVYFGGGLLGNILFLLLTSPFSIAIGASGAIFSLGGVLAIMRPKVRVYIFPIPVPIQLWIAVIGGFLIISFLPNIAWQAHLGGLLFGLIAGYFFRRKERRYSWG
jgi:membrane associated rhomboid family serine protease